MVEDVRMLTSDELQIATETWKGYLKFPGDYLERLKLWYPRLLKHVSEQAAEIERLRDESNHWNERAVLATDRALKAEGEVSSAIAEAVAERTRAIDEEIGDYIIPKGAGWEDATTHLRRAYPEAFTAPAGERKEDV
jgi:hypothetical protein